MVKTPFMKVFAPAKVNLMLHVTGRRTDGYHLLQTLIAPMDLGDMLEISDASAFTLVIDGPFAPHAPACGRNLVAKAAALMEEAAGRTADIAVTLHKHVPAGAGLGGGSADAAAVMHFLNARWGHPFDAAGLAALGLKLGAEMPVCLARAPYWVEGIGETLTPVAVPTLDAVVVWPAVPVPTAEAFKAYAQISPSFRQTQPVPYDIDATWLAACGNDLTGAAITLAPAVAGALEAVAACDACKFSRMTGSGSGVFGIFDDAVAAKKAAADLAAAHPLWWIRMCRINPSS